VNRFHEMTIAITTIPLDSGVGKFIYDVYDLSVHLYKFVKKIFTIRTQENSLHAFSTHQKHNVFLS